MLHFYENRLSKVQHRSLTDIDHQSVIGIGADCSEEQDESYHKQGLSQRLVFGIVHLCQGYDIVVDKGFRKEGRHQGSQ